MTGISGIPILTLFPNKLRWSVEWSAISDVCVCVTGDIVWVFSHTIAISTISEKESRGNSLPKVIYYNSWILLLYFIHFVWHFLMPNAMPEKVILWQFVIFWQISIFPLKWIRAQSTAISGATMQIAYRQSLSPSLTNTSNCRFYFVQCDFPFWIHIRIVWRNCKWIGIVRKNFERKKFNERKKRL